MKKYTYNLYQLIKVEVIDFQHNDAWKFFQKEGTYLDIK